jgi:hypothetical protein
MRRLDLRKAMDCCWPLVLIWMMLSRIYKMSDSRGRHEVRKREVAYVSDNRR